MDGPHILLQNKNMRKTMQQTDNNINRNIQNILQHFKSGVQGGPPAVQARKMLEDVVFNCLLRAFVHFRIMQWHLWAIYFAL